MEKQFFAMNLSPFGPASHSSNNLDHTAFELSAEPLFFMSKN